MAEIFGAVASGAGLVSLSMQLLESAQKLKGFYDSARDAPSTVSRLSSDMKTISLLLRQLEGFRLNQVFGDQVLDSCIKSCEEAVAKIQDSVGKVERLLLVPKTRTLGKTYMGFKEPEIRKLLEEMEHAKSSVLLAFSSYCLCRRRELWARLTWGSKSRRSGSCLRRWNMRRARCCWLSRVTSSTLLPPCSSAIADYSV
jgi:hypothetical protein